MENTNRSSIRATTGIILLLLAALIVLGCVTIKAVGTRNEIQEAVTELCTNSMLDIELNLRQGDDISPEYLYRFHEITQVYPETYYALLSDTLLVLTDSQLSSQLSQSQRDELADCVVVAYDVNLSSEKWDALLYQIENILAPYMYP